MPGQQSIIILEVEGREEFYTSLKKACDKYDLPYNYLIHKKYPFVFKGYIFKKTFINR